ncbi:MAG: M14 family metallopeptidase, partial [Bacteroidia bacterium]|nr:M14 family metallopeptidase [Bacteroidia bacterium]
MQLKQNFTLLLFFFAFSLYGFSQDNLYHRVRILLDGRSLTEIAKTGAAIDHAHIRPGVWVEAELSTSEIAAIQQAGFRTEILIADLESYYATQNQISKQQRISSSGCFTNVSTTIPAGFTLGSMGGFFTYEEMEAHLDTMRARFPNLITAKQPLSPTLTTEEGRPVWVVKISKNPDVDEVEPELYYTAVHHAREPGSLSQLIFFMYYLLENYQTDPNIQYLLDHTELYFTPVLNPDGYIFNQNNDPLGGGMWRKNRRNNGDGTYGVDLNRNYGFNWGYDDLGSSPDPNWGTYRGPAPFSEPETQMVRDFVNQHQFQFALNYHTYSNLLIYPWGYQPDLETDDSIAFRAMARELTSVNHYLPGTANNTVGYISNGDALDWMYGEQTTKPKILCFTPEVGNYQDGFWPPINRIIPLCMENIHPNLTIAYYLLNYADVSENGEKFISQQNGFIPFQIQKLGLANGNPFTVSLSSLTPGVTTGNPKIFALNYLQQTIDSISYTLPVGFPAGNEVIF